MKKFIDSTRFMFEDGEFIVALAEDDSIFAAGKSYKEALDRLENYCLEVKEMIENHNGTLSDKIQKQLDLLNEVLCGE